MVNIILDTIRWLNNGYVIPMQKDQDTKIDLNSEKVELFVDGSGKENKYYYFSEIEIDDENHDNLADIEEVALNSEIYVDIEKPKPSDSYMILFWKVDRIDESLYPYIIQIEENEFFYKKYVFYYTENELECFKKWCKSLETNGKPVLEVVLNDLGKLEDESDQVQFLTRLLSKVPFFNPEFPKAAMKDFDKLVDQKINAVHKDKGNIVLMNNMFLKSIEEESFNTERLSEMIYETMLKE